MNHTKPHPLPFAAAVALALFLTGYAALEMGSLRAHGQVKVYPAFQAAQ